MEAQVYQLQNDMIAKNVDPAKLIKRFDYLRTDREPWNQKWQIIQNYTNPNVRDYVTPARNKVAPSARTRNHTSVVTGKIHKSVSLIMAQIADPAVQWLNLFIADTEMMKNTAVYSWLDRLTQKLYNVFADPETEFYTSTFSLYLDWYTIGTSCREIILRKDNGKLHFNTIPMQDVFIETSGYGVIKNVYRLLSLTASQAFDLFGDRISPKLAQSLAAEENGNKACKHDFVECVIENPMRNNFPAAKYISIVIERETKSICNIEQHTERPYVISRFFVAPGEDYGRSYVWNAMPEIFTINRLNERTLQAIDFASNPVYLVKDQISIPTAQITPGSFLQGLDEMGRPTFQQMSFSGDIPLTMNFYQAELQTLDEALVVKEIFPPDSPNMTATEVTERKIQQSNRLRPLLVRLEAEDLSKTILRTLRLLQQLGELPEFPYDELGISPEELPDPLEQLRVTFAGQMAKMQKMQDLVDIDVIYNKAVEVGNVDPTVFDRLNMDKLLMHEAEIRGVPSDVLNSDIEVDQIRQSRAEQQMQQQQMQNMTSSIDNLIKMKDAGLYDEQF